MSAVHSRKKGIMTQVSGFAALIATDGSPAARAAVLTAVRFPWPAGSRAFGVVAKHVRAEYRRSILLAALDQTADLVATNAARALSGRWPDAQIRVVDASPVHAIVKEAVRLHADVIVMGWRGHGVVRRLLTGTVSRGVVRRAPCAVLVVRRALRDLRHIVVGFDGSAHAQRGVELISRLNPPRGGRVSLFTAVDTMPVPSQGMVPAETRAAISVEVRRINKERVAGAHQALDRASRALTRAGWKVDSVVSTGAPLRELLATVAKKRADLVVVGAKGVTGVRHLLLGSVADGVLNRSRVPVFIAR
jgi:nucleotide-binding universal stress UspA family protein